MLRFAIVVALVGACVALNSELDGYWREYKKVHGKWYSLEEEPVRRELFEESVRLINSHNLRNDLGLSSHRLGLNKFADLTSVESMQYRGFRFNATIMPRRGQFQPVMSPNVPTSVDWRTKGYVTPVKNQAQCGSCWAFSTTGSLEGQHFAKTGKLVSLSEQNLVDCAGDYGNLGCKGGMMDRAFAYIKANGGIDTEESYPYTAQEGKCRFKKDSVGATVTGYVDIPSNNERALKHAVGSVGPVSVAIDASHRSFHLYHSGVYDESKCDPTMLDHGVLVVGYGSDNGKDFWLVKNSWGPSWGEEGYIRMSRNKRNQCGIASMASYPTV